MASIKPYRNGWRVQIKTPRGRDSGTFKTKREAAQWALAREAQLDGRQLPAECLGDALKRYRDEVSPTHRGHRWQVLRLNALRAAPIAGQMLSAITGADIAT